MDVSLSLLPPARSLAGASYLLFLLSSKSPRLVQETQAETGLLTSEQATCSVLMGGLPCGAARRGVRANPLPEPVRSCPGDHTPSLRALPPLPGGQEQSSLGEQLSPRLIIQVPQEMAAPKLIGSDQESHETSGVTGCERRSRGQEQGLSVHRTPRARAPPQTDAQGSGAAMDSPRPRAAAKVGERMGQ